MKKSSMVLAMGISCFSSLVWAGGHAHWSYSGQSGPMHWGSLDPAYGACASGKSQSPIDLKEFVESDLKPVAFAYKAGGNEIINNGHTVQVNFVNGGEVEIDGHTYALKQFHFHAPSENTVSGRSFPMEAHFVHADASGHLAVIAVFFDEGAANPDLGSFFPLLPYNAGEKKALAAPLNADALMPVSKEVYRYAGSLTTPPCTEGVSWLVMKAPLAASKEQINQLKHVLHHANNRPVQPLNGRKVEQ